MKRICTLFTAIAFFFQMAANKAKAQSIFLDFTGVKGGSIAGWPGSPAYLLEVSSVGITAACNTCATIPGNTGAKVVPGKFVFNVKDDRALIDLRKLMYAQTLTVSACFVFRKASGGDANAGSYNYISLGYTTVIEIDEVTTEGGGTTAYQVSLAYGQIQYSFRPKIPDGTLGAPVVTGWDYVKNSPTTLAIPKGL